MTWRTALILSAVLNLMLLPVLANFSSKNNLETTAPIEIELADLNETLPQQISPYSIPAAQSASSPPLTSASTIDNTVMPSMASTDNIAATNASGLVFSSVQSTGNGNTAALSTNANQNISSYTPPSNPPAAPQSVILRPQILESPVYYPEQARREGLKGVVNLSIEVLTNGQAGSISVIDSSGSSLLDEAAVQSARQWRFIPARDSVSGIAVECTITGHINFNLN